MPFLQSFARQMLRKYVIHDMRQKSCIIPGDLPPIIKFNRRLEEKLLAAGLNPAIFLPFVRAARPVTSLFSQNNVPRAYPNRELRPHSPRFTSQ